jgi:hypothetical protein
MKKVIRVLWYAFVISTGTSAFAAEGAASKAELQQLFQRYFQQKDEKKIGTLAYWRGVEPRDRDGFFRSVHSDLNYRLKKIEFVPLDLGLKLAYTRDGVTYMPALPAVGRIVAHYEDQGNAKHVSTSYVIGVKDGRYYIDLAAPKLRD